jgi:hypothetical protein
VFQFRLALALGRTVDELHASMSSAEYAEWVRFASYEPFGEMRDDYRIARLGMQLVGAFVGTKGNKMQLDDFRLRFQHTSTKMRLQQAESNAKCLVGLLGVGPSSLMGGK